MTPPQDKTRRHKPFVPENMQMREFTLRAVLLGLLLPTLLIKNQPWTAAEIASLNRFLAPPEADPTHRLRLVENPLDPAERFLSQDFYSGEFPDELADRTSAGP